MTADRWLDWLLRGRSGGEEGHRAAQELLRTVRDRVLKDAQLQAGQTLLDVGTGDGLIGLAALDAIRPGGHVIFADISEPCLAYVAEQVRARGEDGVASFVALSADSLAPIADDSVDAVTTRSVLIYVEDKASTFRAMHFAGC